MNISIAEMQRMTGKGYTTIKRRLDKAGLTGEQDGRSLTFESEKALPAIYQASDSAADALTRERTRLAAAQAEKTELEVKEKTGQLIPAEEVAETWGEIVGAIRSKLLGLPVKLARVAIAAESLKEVEEAARDEVYIMLKELARTELSSDDVEPVADITSN